MKNIFFITLTLLLFSFGCKTAKSTKTNKKEKQPQEMTINKTTKWILTSYNGQKPQEAGFKERIPYLKIDKEAGSISGNSGCNSFSGPVELEGNKIKVGVLASTKAYCMGVPEYDFFTFLNDADNYKIKGDTLQLLKEDKVLLEFTAEK
jgi:putative lipoprotein